MLISSARMLFCSFLANDLSELCVLEDQEFVDAAHDILVQRQISVEDANRFVLLIRQGFSKCYVLAEMAHYWGADFYPGRLPGLRQHLKRFRYGNLPVIGYFFRFIFRLPDNNFKARRFRVIENQQYLLAKFFFERSGSEFFPDAPWGGLHRFPLLESMITIESKMPHEIKIIYGDLMSAAEKIKK